MRAETDSRRSVEEAFARVLDAEQEALRQIAACESRADKDLKQTRQTIRVLAGQTQDRIGRLHSGCARRTRELVRNMERDAAAPGSSVDARPDEEARLLAAVREFAAWLTTPGPGDGR